MTFKLFLIFLLAHLLSDFIFQSNKMAKEKGGPICKKKWKSLFFHIAIHFGFIILIISIIYIIDSDYIDFVKFKIIEMIFFILISHFIIDFLKFILNKKKPVFNFLLDQFLHISCIYLSIIIVLKKELVIFLDKGNYTIYNFQIIDKVLIISILFLIGTYFAAYFIQAYLKLTIPSNIIVNSQMTLTQSGMLNKIAENIDTKIETVIQHSENSSFSFGLKIGLIERTLIILLISSNNYGVIAIIVGLKTLTRFKMIEQNKDFGEYYLMGNLLSLLFSILIGILIKIVWTI